MTETVKLLGGGVLALVVGCTTVGPERPEGPWTAETLGELSRDPQPEGLSDISRIAGNRYYCVDDRGGMLHELEIVLDEDGFVDSCRTVRSVRLAGRVDLEGCAYDPLDGRVWVSDENDHSIRQFDPVTGQETARADVPEVYLENMVANRSFEALAISPDGLRMYAANEDSLTCDGPVSSRKKGGVVRIQEFVRDGKGAPWVQTRQFRYQVETVKGEPYSGLALSGVVALAVTEEGTLLVLEREMSRKNPLLPSCLARLYEVTFPSFGSTVSKREVWQEDTCFSNYEGLCLGPALKNGRRTMVLVSDGGGSADESVMVLGY